MKRHAKATSAFTLGRNGSAAVLLALAAFLFLFPVAAHAAPKGAVGDFGSAGTGNGQFSSVSPSPVGLAVNQNGTGGAAAGDVYAVDPGNNRVQRFDSTGAFLGAFGSTGTGKGQFQNPRGVAIDQTTGAVYVTDQTNRRVQKFSATGAFERMWGWGVLNGAAEFQVCTSAQTCQAGTSGNGAGAFSSTLGFPAVEPISGDVYVGDATNRRVQVFDSSGNFLRAMGWDVSTGGSAGFEICAGAECRAGVTGGTEDGRFGSNQPVHLAIDSSGATDVLFASDSNLNNRVQRIDITAPAAPVAMSAIGSLGSPLLDATTSGLAVDPATNNLLVARDPSSGETVLQELTNPTNTIVPLPAVADTHAAGETWGTTASGTVTAIAVHGPTGRIYVSRSEPRQVAILAAGTAPVTSLNATSAIAPTSATLNATINPSGSKTYYQFQYRQVGAGSFTSVPAAMTSIGNGGGNVNLTAPLTGLFPGASYEVQLRADGYGAPQLVGADATGDFSTPAIPPTVSDRPAAPVTETTALLQAELTPNNAATTYFFQYLTDASFKANGNSYSGPHAPIQVPVIPAVLPAGMSPVVAFELVSGLAPETAYHFRVIANNGTGGDQVGADRTFTTASDPIPGVPGEKRAYELVSPSYKSAGIGVGMTYRDFYDLRSGAAATEGDRYAVEGNYGSTLIDEGPAFVSNWAFAERASDSVGWLSHQPASHALTVFQVTRFLLLATATPDLSRVVWSSNGPFQVFPELAGTAFGTNASYFGDWDGRWELIGPTAEGQGSGEFQRLFSRDGSRLLHWGPLFGMAGADAPDHPSLGQRLAGRSIYLADTSGAPADNYAGTGPRILVNTCAGAGSDRTTIPSQAPSGKLEGQACPAPTGGASERLISPYGAALAPGGGSGIVADPVKNAISADGSRAFFMAPDISVEESSNPGTLKCTSGTGTATSCPPQIYLRQTEADGSNPRVRWISRAEDGLFGSQDASLTAQVFYEGASEDGSSVFFRTKAPLTADDPNGARDANGNVVPPPVGGVTTGTPSETSWDLYRYELPSVPTSDPGDGTLTRITAGPTGGADCSNPQGLPSPGLGPVPTDRSSTLRFLSEDGTRAYFVCAEPLPGVPAPSNGTITAATGSPTTQTHANLYLYDANLPPAERYRFVARLPRSTEGSSLSSCATSGGVEHNAIMPLALTENRPNCFFGTADGRFVSFFTDGRLTADDPDGTSGDVYAYDATADRLSRVTAPVPGAVGGTTPCFETAGTQCFGLGAYDLGSSDIPALNVAVDPADPANPLVFIQSRSRLTPDDTDTGLFDVYQWRDGELTLLSTGTPTEHAIYKGASADARNVYLVTRQRLSWQDTDAVADVYTARLGGGIPQPPAPPVCEVLADGCQGAAARQPTPSPAASTVLEGGGNVVVKPKPGKCPKGKVRKGKRCVKKAKAKRGGKKSRRANPDRRTAR